MKNALLQHMSVQSLANTLNSQGAEQKLNKQLCLEALQAVSMLSGRKALGQCRQQLLQQYFALWEHKHAYQPAWRYACVRRVKSSDMLLQQLAKSLAGGKMRMHALATQCMEAMEISQQNQCLWLRLSSHALLTLHHMMHAMNGLPAALCSAVAGESCVEQGVSLCRPCLWGSGLSQSLGRPGLKGLL